MELPKNFLNTFRPVTSTRNPRGFFQGMRIFQSEYADQKSSRGIWKTSGSLEKSIGLVHGERWGLCGFVIFNSISSHLISTHTMELIPTTSLRVGNVISRITLAVVEQKNWTISYIYSLKMLKGLHAFAHLQWTWV